MPPTTPPRETAEILAWSRDVIEPGLRAAVATLPVLVKRTADFHFGWCDEDGNPVSSSGGKAIRPALTLLMAEAAGGSWEAALPAAITTQVSPVAASDQVLRRRGARRAVVGRDSLVRRGLAT